MIRIMTNDETWLTAAQAAKILRVTERQVNRYGAEGRLRTQRAGQRSDKENAPGSSPGAFANLVREAVGLYACIGPLKISLHLAHVRGVLPHFA